jgi:hypothetical protein
MDDDYSSLKNLSKLYSLKIPFSIRMSKNRSEYKQLIFNHGQDLNHGKNLIQYGDRVLYGKRYNIHK